MISAKLNLDIYKGTTFFREFAYTDEAGVAIPMTNWVPQCDARKMVGKTLDDEVAFNLGCTITDEAAGEYKFEISDEDTKLLTEGSYRYDLVFDKPDGTRTEPIMSGRVTVHQIASQPQ